MPGLYCFLFEFCLGWAELWVVPRHPGLGDLQAVFEALEVWIRGYFQVELCAICILGNLDDVICEESTKEQHVEAELDRRQYGILWDSTGDRDLL